MNAETWYESNNRYLAASLQWLRAKLTQFAADQTRAPGNDGINPWQRWIGKEPRRITSNDVTAAAALREEVVKAGPPPGLLMLAERFGLSAFERDTLMMCAALDLDPGFAALCAHAQGAPSR